MALAKSFVHFLGQRISNEAVLRRMNEKRIAANKKGRRMRYLGHVMRRGKTQNLS